MIIPLRVTEFTVTPKDCIPYVNNKWMLQIRRTKLKGKVGNFHGYKLDDDYKIYKYAVTDEIASMLQDYQNRAKKYDEAEIDSLFSDDMVVKLLNAKNMVKMNHLATPHMALLLDYFYTDIIEKKYGFKIFNKADILTPDKNGELKQLSEYEIIKISLGDSRHIAMQNMLLNGCNILMAKEITGHESANMIFHYSGNMKNLIKCRAYSLFQKSKQNVVEIPKVMKINETMAFRQPEALHIEVDAGLCYSIPFVMEGDIKDCSAVAGNCDNCDYCIPENDSLFIRKEQERIVEEKIERLIEWLSSARMYKNKDEFRVIANQLEASIENLQNGYVQDLKKGLKI